jgi:hypothetical protein
MPSQLPSPRGLDIDSPNNSGIRGPSSSATDTTSGGDFLIYQNNTFAVRMQYPFDWSKVQNDTNGLDRSNEIVSFYSSNENSSDTYAENVMLKVLDPAGQNKSLDDHLYDSINYHRENSTDFSIIEASTNTTLAAKPAYKLIYDHLTLQNNTSLQTMEIGTIIGDKLYAISYNAEPGNYPNYYSTYVLRMINSLDITNSNNNSSR